MDTKKLRKIGAVVLALAALVAISYWFSLDKSVRYLILNQPNHPNPLFWDVEQRDAAFQSLEKLKVLPFNIVHKGDTVREFDITTPLSISKEQVSRYFDQQRIAGLVVLHKGKLVFEHYDLGLDETRKWTSFSVAKSFTSTLVGAAIKDGYISSLDDNVSTYIPDLVGSQYENVTIHQLLTMTSGIQWNEDYDDPQSDVNRFNYNEPDPGVDATVSYMRKLPAAYPPGTHWAYSTGESNLIGVLVAQATGKTLSDYLSEKVWQHIGAAQDASWLLDSTGHEIGGCCIQATTRDYALFGDFILGNATINGESILPDGYLKTATTKQADIGSDNAGYGYQWWTFNDGTFQGRGIFGQGIFISPEDELVIALNSNWPGAKVSELAEARLNMYRDIQTLVQQQLVH